VDWNQDTLWLSMNVAGGANATSTGCTPFSNCTPDGEMLPMRRLTSSVYALNSAQLGGLTSSQFVQLATGIQTDSSTTQPSIGINKTAGSQNLITLQASGTDVFDVSATGSVLHRTTTNSTTAFQVQNSSGTALLNTDTTNARVTVNGTVDSQYGGLGLLGNLLTYSEQMG
jgi:hypothetical protein